MSSVVISGDTSGAITLSAPAVAGTNTATLPASTGTVMVSGNMPAFSAYSSSSATIATSAFTKVPYQTKNFDTNNYFDATTNYRFTPLIAGYYQFNASVAYAANNIQGLISIYKNGSENIRGSFCYGGNNGCGFTASGLIYMNGSTDYVEAYAYQTSGAGQATAAVSYVTYFNGAMIRSA